MLTEPETPQALALIGSAPLLAPDFIWLECANVLVRDVRRGLLDEATAGEALAALRGTPVQLAPMLAHLDAARRLAVELEQSVHDCLYLAVALAEAATLVTADARFAAAAERVETYAARVRRL